MQITRQEVEHIAALARLELGPEELEAMAEHMNEILGHMGQLAEVDTTGIEPTSHAVGQVNAFRQDKVQPWLATDEALANAPEDDGASFIVPKVI